MQELDDLRSQVARACQMLGRLKLTVEPFGHVSARIAGSDNLLIKGRGPDEAPLSYTTPDDLIVVDMAGKLIEGRDGLASPAEVFIHTWVYRLRPDVHSVLHVHPPTIVAFTIAGRPLLPVTGSYSMAALDIYFDDVPTFPISVLINSDERGEALARTLGLGRVCMMRGHGITAAGVSPADATLNAIHLNDLAEINYRAAMLGEPHSVPDEDLQEYRQRFASERGAAAGRERPDPRLGAEWRYYDRLIGD